MYMFFFINSYFMKVILKINIKEIVINNFVFDFGFLMYVKGI